MFFLDLANAALQHTFSNQIVTVVNPKKLRERTKNIYIEVFWSSIMIYCDGSLHGLYFPPILSLFLFTQDRSSRVNSGQV